MSPLRYHRREVQAFPARYQVETVDSTGLYILWEFRWMYGSRGMNLGHTWRIKGTIHLTFDVACF